MFLGPFLKRVFFLLNSRKETFIIIVTENLLFILEMTHQIYHRDTYLFKTNLTGEMRS